MEIGADGMIDAAINAKREQAWIADAMRERIGKIRNASDQARFEIDFRTRKELVTNGLCDRMPRRA